MVDLTDLSKFPINTRGYTVVPCIELVHDNMNSSLIGLKVTVGLGSYDYGTTDPGTICGYDEKKIHLKMGSKVKKFEYDPVFIQLQVYQFDKKIMFSNDRVSERELAQSHKEFYEDDSKEKKSFQSSPQKKEVKNDVDPPKKKVAAKKGRSKKPKDTSDQEKAKLGYQPKFGIEWS